MYSHTDKRGGSLFSRLVFSGRVKKFLSVTCASKFAPFRIKSGGADGGNMFSDSPYLASSSFLSGGLKTFYFFGIFVCTNPG